VSGYLAAKGTWTGVLTPQVNAEMLGNLATACAAQPEMSLLAVVEAATGGATAGGAATGPTEADVRALLATFMQPGADLRALTLSLAPTEADIRAVFSEPLASKLVPHYAAMFASSQAVIGPKAGQTAVLVTLTTTGRLKSGGPDLAEFPGGYADVAPYFNQDVPIVRFKFVEPGETLGMAFDGLAFVNGRWVIMPKPWAAN
jgi:hypothetical protein